MNSSNRNRSVPFFRYFPASIKFYGLRNDKIAAFVFVILLAVNFCANIFVVKYSSNLTIDSSNQVVSGDIIQTLEYLIRIGIVSIISSLLMNIFSSFYIYAFMRDLRGIPYTFKECLKFCFSKFLKLILVSVISSLAVFTGSMIFIIPGIVLYIMFIFSNQVMIDQNKGVFSSLKGSLDLTNGYKMGIFTAVVVFNLLILLFPSFVEAGNGLLVFSFVSAFISTIFNLIFQRFLTLIYFDLEYLRKPKKVDINI